MSFDLSIQDGHASGPGPGVLWQHCQNSFGIARLLLHDRRPADLLDTACHTALEYACRAALEVAGRPPFVGDVTQALSSLAAPEDLVSGTAEEGEDPQARLAATERRLAWLSEEMRRRMPERHWRY